MRHSVDLSPAGQIFRVAQKSKSLLSDQKLY